MSEFLRRRAWLRGAVGTSAAFVFALQMLLAGIAATQMAAADSADPFVICYGDHAPDGPDGTAGTGVHHASCVICALASFSPPVPQTAALPVIRSSATAVFQFAPQASPDVRRRHDPRSSQGPPQAA